MHLGELSEGAKIIIKKAEKNKPFKRLRIRFFLGVKGLVLSEIG